MDNFVTNVERDQVFNMLKTGYHVYCYNWQTCEVYDLYYYEVNNIHLLLSNAETVVFFIIDNGKE